MSNEGAFFVGAFCGAIVAAVVVGFSCYYIGRDNVRLEAIKANVGEYYLDANHNKQFRWKDAK